MTLEATDAPIAPDAPLAPNPETAIAPASELIVESSLARITRAPAALISSAAESTSPMSEMRASTLLRIQLRETEPAPPISLASPPDTATVAICTFWLGGKSTGLAKVAVTLMSPLVDVSGAPTTVAWTLSVISLTATATPTPALPLIFAPTVPAKAEIAAVSLASKPIEPSALTLADPAAALLRCASTVFLMVLTAKEPPSVAVPPPDPAPPTTTLRIRADSVAVTSTAPAFDSSFTSSTVAVTMLRMSLTPIEAAIAPTTLSPLPNFTASAPAPPSIREASCASTSMSPSAVTLPGVTLPGPPATFAMWASTFIRTKFSEIAPAPLGPLPAAAPTVPAVSCDEMGEGRSTVRLPTLTLCFLTSSLWPTPVPTLVSGIGLAERGCASRTVLPSLMQSLSTLMAK